MKQARSSDHPSGAKSKAQGASPQREPGTIPAGLYLVATPIGHARDISLRALEVLAAADLIACEDTRVTAKLLAIHGIARPLAAYNDHNAARERPKLLAKIAGGARVALVSDAGTPLVSDPGYKLVREALEENLLVDVIPGASAVLAGLSLSGLPSDRFLFAGFLSHAQGERRAALDELKTVRATLIFFESTQRLGDSLTAMAEIFGARDAVVARELTKLHQDVRRGTLADLAAHYTKADAPRGEATLLVGPPEKPETDFGKVDAALEAALAFMPLRAAADMIAALSDAPRKQVYDRGLVIKEKSRG